MPALSQQHNNLGRLPGAECQVCDLHQRPPARAVHSKGGKMFCIVKNLTLAFDLELGRPWTTSELMTAMGLPIVEHHAALTGVACAFARSSPAPASRTYRSSVAQAGNAMHVASIGSVVMLCILTFPDLGTKSGQTGTKRPGSNPQVQMPIDRSPPAVAPHASESSSVFAEAFARLKRQRRPVAP